MSKISINDIVDEVLIFVRNQVTDPISPVRVTNVTEEFNGDGATKVFTLTNIPVQNVKTLTVDTVTKSFGTDYTTDNSAQTITLNIAPGTGTDNVDVNYDYGSPTWIYPDTPRTSIRLTSFPRMSVTVPASSTDVIGLNADGYMTSLLIDITAFGKNENQINDLLNQIKDAIMDNAKSFYYFNFIKPISLSPLINFKDGNNEIVQRTQSYEIPFIFES